MFRVQPLPRWVLPYPSGIYDLESTTIGEMVPKLYGVIKNLVEDYNKLVDEINEEIKNFTGSSEKEIEEFKKTIEKRLICKFQVIDATFSGFSLELKKIATDTKEYTQELVNTAIQNGDIGVSLVYDEETEEIRLVANGGV